MTVSGSVSVNDIFFNGTGYIVAGTTLTLTGGNITTNANATISAPLGGSVGLMKFGSATLTLSGASSYTGSTVINAGTLQLSGSANRLPTGTAVVLANTAGATLDLNGQNQTIASLAGGGAAGGNILTGGGTLTVGDATDTGYAGIISENGGLTKQGSGTLTLYGANTYSGLTNVTAGTLAREQATHSARALYGERSDCDFRSRCES